MGDLVIDNGRTEAKWVSYIKGRVSNNKNFLGIVTGPTGSGKSWSALSICSQLDKNFNLDRVIFSMKELMGLINNGNLKSGSCILWDEAGIDLSNRNWQSLTNKLINALIQTFRHKRLILIMTTPYLDFVDASTRKLFHAEIITQAIDYNSKTTKVKPQLIQYNTRNKKFYYKYLRVRTKLGVSPIKSWKVEAPPKWLVDVYKDKKNKFTGELNKSIEEQLNEVENKNKKELTEKQKEVLKVLQTTKGNVEEASELCGMKVRNIYFHVAQAKKKGYTWENMVN